MAKRKPAKQDGDDDALAAPPERPLQAAFYKTDSGNEPVREWLRGLNDEDKKAIGADIQTVQWGWPMGMPLVRKFSGKAYIGLREIRSHLSGKQIARVLFTVHDRVIVLLLGFIKKSRKTPKEDLDLANDRKRKVNRHN